jgi:8-oxo-dGTP pyrophosphatase MutT (NUDIX family)
VKYGGQKWKNDIRFRDYLNANFASAKMYESVKAELALRYPTDRIAYTDGKDKIVSQILRKAQTWALLDTIVTVKIDRPVGIYHPRTNTIFYSINYGYLEDEIAPDNSGLDVYVLGIVEPMQTFTGRVIGIIHRENDVEDKLVAAPDGMVFTQNEIGEAVHFQEQFFSTTIEAIYHRSAGMIVYRITNGEPEYLVLFQHKSRTWSFAKGHMNAFETEEQTARREVQEEIGLDLIPLPNFHDEITYPVDGITKTVAFFLAELKGEPKPDNDEITDCCWVDKDEAVRLIGNRDFTAILERVESYNR